MVGRLNRIVNPNQFPLIGIQIILDGRPQAGAGRNIIRRVRGGNGSRSRRQSHWPHDRGGNWHRPPARSPPAHRSGRHRACPPPALANWAMARVRNSGSVSSGQARQTILSDQILQGAGRSRQQARTGIGAEALNCPTRRIISAAIRSAQYVPGIGLRRRPGRQLGLHLRNQGRRQIPTGRGRPGAVAKSYGLPNVPVPAVRVRIAMGDTKLSGAVRLASNH